MVPNRALPQATAVFDKRLSGDSEGGRGDDSARQLQGLDFCLRRGLLLRGAWDKGQTIKFLPPSGDGKVSEIAEHLPNAYISIRHLGLLAKGVVDTESESVRAWAPAYENDAFTATPDGTRLVVDQDVPEDWERHLAEAWPKVLEKLKSLDEADGRLS